MEITYDYGREMRLRSTIVRHPDFAGITKRIEECHDFSLKTKTPTYLLILGEPGVGKSTLLKNYAARYPRQNNGRATQVPVLFVEIPPSPSLVSLVDAFLGAYGEIYVQRSRRPIGVMTRQLVALMKAAGTSVILIDELQNFMTQASHTQVKALAAWLKSLMNTLPIALIAAGIPESQRLVNADDQLRSRMSAEMWIKPFSIEAKESYETFRKVLFSVERSLEFPAPSLLYDNPLAEQVYYACDGRFRLLTALLSSAIRIAEQKDEERISKAVLHEAFLRTFRSDATDRDNPFSDTFIPRRLTGTGEAHGPRAIS